MADIYGTQGSDIRQGTDFADVIRGWAQGGDPSTDLGDQLYGRDGDDIIKGGGGDDHLYGNKGNDSLEGGRGFDSLYGGSQNDTLYGGDDGDALNGETGNDYLYGETGNDTLSGSDGNDFLDGWTGRDMLHGGSNNDTLLGFGGRDYLDGGSGDDFLAGEHNADRFAFGGGYNRDTITDFKDDVDTIELFGASLGVGSVPQALFHAQVIAGDTVFTFDTGDVLIVENIADPTLLRDDLAIV